MRTTRRAARAAAMLCIAMLPLSACTAKYQDMLRDRDETIRDLEGKLSLARSDNAKLNRDLARAKSDLDAAKAVSAVARKPAADKDPLAKLQADLRGEGLGKGAVDARYRHGRISIGIANRVTFAAGSTRISPEGKAILKRLARVLKRNWPGKRIYIEGHTDRDPIRKTKNKYRSNRHLSVERADAVAAFLTRKAGMHEDRVVIMGFGPYDPVSKSDKALNRRVEIVVAD